MNKGLRGVYPPVFETEARENLTTEYTERHGISANVTFCRFLESLSAQVFPPRRQGAKNLNPRIARISRIFFPRCLANFLAADVADERRFREDAGNQKKKMREERGNAKNLLVAFRNPPAETPL